MKKISAKLLALCLAGGMLPTAYAANAYAVEIPASIPASANVNADHPADAVITFDFGGTYNAKPGDTVKVPVKIKSGENPVIAMDVVFAQDSPIEMIDIGETTPAFEKNTVSKNILLPGCNFQSRDDATGEGIIADESKAVFNLTYKVPSNCPAGEYKIGFGDKCEVYIDNTAWVYKTESIAGIIKVEEDPNAEKYALGDVNNDGTVDGSDATIVLREFGQVLAGKPAQFTDAQFAAGDVDKNGVIDGSDATLILKFFGEAGKDIEISYGGMEPWMEKNFWNTHE